MILLGEEFSGEAPLLGDEVWQPVDGHLLDRLRSGPVELAVDVKPLGEGLERRLDRGAEFSWGWCLYFSLKYCQNAAYAPHDIPKPSCSQESEPASFLPRAPIFEVPRTTVLNITDGSVYHGTSFPKFHDSCHSADCAFGRIVALRENGGKWKHKIIAFEPAITGVDPRDGELLFARMAKGKTMRLVRNDKKP